MALALTQPQRSLREQTTFRFAVCWRITRADGEVKRFTNHNGMIVLGDGEEFPPRGGFDATAVRQESGLRSPNLEYAGMLSSDAITEEDLRAGRYRGAKITEMLVDWAYPWAGVWVENKYEVQQVEWTPFGWQAQIATVADRLEHEVGRIFNRNCDTTLGSDRCKVDIEPLTEEATVVNVSGGMPAQRFFADSLDHGAGHDMGAQDEWYQFGVVEWTSGNNQGLRFDVMRSREEDGRITLETKTPFPIQVGDEFTIHPGCNRTHDHCLNKFVNPDDPTNALGRGNVDNFQGFPTIPGTDKAMQSPKAK